jgi:hypothetical protein
MALILQLRQLMIFALAPAWHIEASRRVNSAPL